MPQHHFNKEKLKLHTRIIHTTGPICPLKFPSFHSLEGELKKKKKKDLKSTLQQHSASYEILSILNIMYTSSFSEPDIGFKVCGAGGMTTHSTILELSFGRIAGVSWKRGAVCCCSCPPQQPVTTPEGGWAGAQAPASLASRQQFSCCCSMA